MDVTILMLWQRAQMILHGNHVKEDELAQPTGTCTNYPDLAAPSKNVLAKIDGAHYGDTALHGIIWDGKERPSHKLKPKISELFG